MREDNMQIGKWKITIKDFVWCIICLIIMLSFLVGILLVNDSSAAAVVSGASTAISIVLSVVAILYTMIEGANSSRLNEGSINKLNSIDARLEEVTQKVAELKSLDSKIKYVVPKLDVAVQKIEESSKENTEIVFDDDVKKAIQDLQIYLKEDIDE